MPPETESMAQKLETSIKFTEYVAESLNKSMEYSNYLAESIDELHKRLERNSNLIMVDTNIEHGNFAAVNVAVRAGEEETILQLEVFDTIRLGELTELEQKVALTFLDAFLREGTEATFAFRLARKNLHALGLLIDQESYVRKRKLQALGS